MDSERAKTILIIILLFLNVGLFALNYYGTSEKRITADEVSTIKSILMDNNIELLCELPNQSRPVRLITVAEANWDADYVKDIFFAYDNEVIRTNESGNVIYRSGDKTVTISNALSSGVPVIVKYEEQFETNGTAGHKTAAKYKEMLGEAFEGFKLHRVIVEDEKETYIYNELIDEKAIYCSFVQIEVYEESVLLTIKKYELVSYLEGISHIYRADEALLAFMHYAVSAFDGKVSVDGYSLGYNIDESSSTETYKARLYYRIFVVGYNEPVYIDAVTNTIYNFS